jgi:hypothetical protein
MPGNFEMSVVGKTRGVRSVYLLERDGTVVDKMGAGPSKRILEFVGEVLFILQPRYWVLQCRGLILVFKCLGSQRVLVVEGEADFGALRYTLDKMT